MPKLWNETVEAHRRDVRDAILDAAAALVGERGLLSVTMSEVAERTGIGRATLYKYFPDVEAILFAWHERQVSAHLAELAEIGSGAGNAVARLEAVLSAYAHIIHRTHGRHDAGLSALLHRGLHAERAQHRLRDMIRDLVSEGAREGEIRDDVAAEELAGYCLAALSAASGLPNKAAVRRLVAVTLAGLRRPG